MSDSNTNVLGGSASIAQRELLGETLARTVLDMAEELGATHPDIWDIERVRSQCRLIDGLAQRIKASGQSEARRAIEARRVPA